MHIEFRLLGELRAHVDGREVDLGPARQQCVLAALLVDANHTVSLDQLATRVWGESQPQCLGGTVRSYLSRLRATLPATAGCSIERRSSGYVIHVEDTVVDLHRFRQLLAEARTETDEESKVLLYQQALALWRGEAFANLHGDWLDSVRTTLQSERFAAALDYHDIQLRRGEHTILLPALTAFSLDYPLDERLAGQMILALYRNERQADALNHYEMIRRRLADELGVDPNPHLQQLYQHILAGGLTVDSTRSERAHAWALPSEWGPQPQKAGYSVVPRQLPADTRRFMGRESELQRLATLLERRRHASPKTAQLVVVTGSAGVGKTSLVVHWAHKVCDEFRDGQIYLDLRGLVPSDPIATTAQAVRGFLEALEVPPWRIPSELHAQIGLYRSLLATKQVLIVLDGVSDSEQVRFLLPGASDCLMVATSREWLIDLVAIADAHFFPLEPFTKDEAWDMLYHRLGVDRVAAETMAVGEIIERCAGLPQALAAVTASALAYPHLRLADLATQICAGGQYADLPFGGEFELFDFEGEERRRGLTCESP